MVAKAATSCETRESLLNHKCQFDRIAIHLILRKRSTNPFTKTVDVECRNRRKLRDTDRSNNSLQDLMTG